ncbi:hypothetical protein M758_8G117800 [Ceratodon purpureus]|nr:hypothetical protein KC19_N019400 [Ceratodon purpureus]KAG0608595.1 hypothetical protein M758_8G117800 [Ceratodon purpureus]
MESFPQKIALAMFVSASMTPSGVPLNGSLLGDLMFKSTLLGEATTFTFANGADKPPTSMMISDKYISELYYNGCSPEDIELASTLRKWYPVDFGRLCYLHQRKTWTGTCGVCEESTR